MTDLAVETTGLTKRYRGGALAVDRIDLRVARGEIYAFLGLNGAGKSTTIRMLLGMIRPTAGHAELFGQRVNSGATSLWRRVGHLVESATAYPELSVRDNLDIARRLAWNDRPWRRGCGHRAAVSRAIRGSAGRHPVARQPPAPCSRQGSAPRTRAARARRAGERTRPGRRHRDPGVAPIACHRARRHRVHVEPHPWRGRSARHEDRDRASRAPGGGTRPRCARTPPRPATRGRGEGSRSRRGGAAVRRPLARSDPAGRPRAARAASAGRARRGRGPARRSRGATDPARRSRASRSRTTSCA